VTRGWISAPRAPLLALLVGGLAVGAFSFALVRSEPGYALVDDSIGRAVAELVAGYALIAVGARSWIRRPESRFGALLVAAGIGWFLAEWNNPEIGSSLGFSVGLAFSAVAPALVAHAALTYPDGRLSSRIDRLAVTVAYLGAVVVLGLLPAIFFDPGAAGCAQCPENLLLVNDSAGRFEDLNRAGVDIGLAWSLGLAALLVLRLVRSTAALRRLIWPVVVAATAYLGLVAADFAHSLDRGFLGNDATDVDLRLAEAGALFALSLGVAWSWVRARNTRAEVARLIVELARSPAPGGLREALADTLGDPMIELAYPLEDGQLVDASGGAVTVQGEAATALVRDGQEVALLSHRAGLLDDPGLEEELAAAARLALENERLRAQAGAQLRDLRASRARVIATGDAERRRLERDLHDGAQQRLVGLSLSLRLARSGLGPEPDPSLIALLDEADVELRTALAELRNVAHGIFPAVLADEGLAAALEAFAEEAPVPIELADLPEGRFEPAVEAAAYLVVSETVREGDPIGLRITATWRNGRLQIQVDGNGDPHELIEAEDRVGALDGTIAVAREPCGRFTVRAEIPCES
jgi:signal transduction histidine kinase